jgi:hypothetical protein
MIDELKQFHEDLKGLRKALKAQATEQVAKKALRTSANELGSRRTR